LRVQAQPVISLVAEIDHCVVGHIMFTAVSLSGHPRAQDHGTAAWISTGDIRNHSISCSIQQCLTHRTHGISFTMDHQQQRTMRRKYVRAESLCMA
jgi:hypothetical protein